jgi:hypothetical protein
MSDLRPTARERDQRRVENTPAHKAATAEAIAFVEQVATHLGHAGTVYQYTQGEPGLERLGDTDVILSVRPALLGPDAVSDGHTLCVRILGPRPDRRVYYAHTLTSRPRNAAQISLRIARIVGYARSARSQSAQPTVLQVAERRVLIGIGAFGSKARVLSGCQVRVDLPGGARLDVYGQRDHDLQLQHLSDAQLAAVLRAIAESVDRQRPTPNPESACDA